MLKSTFSEVDIVQIIHLWFDITELGWAMVS